MKKKKSKMPLLEKQAPNPAAVALGRLGGLVTRERGTEYYRKLSAKRKNFKGGRPPKSNKT